MRHVFVSYGREDSKLALRLAADLKARKADVWIDQLDIHPGQQWDLEVEQALRECNKLLVILSKHSVVSNNVMDEISFALDEGKVVIPVVADDCEIPFRLRRRQYIDLRSDYEHGVESLVVTISRQGQPETPAVSPAPVLELITAGSRVPSAAVHVSAGEPSRGKTPRHRASAPLLWTAGYGTAGGAALTLTVLFSVYRGGGYSKTLLLLANLFALLSLAQFVAWKWPRVGLGLGALMTLCLLGIGAAARLDIIGIALVGICASPAVLLFIRSRIDKEE